MIRYHVSERRGRFAVVAVDGERAWVVSVHADPLRAEMEESRLNHEAQSEPGGTRIVNKTGGFCAGRLVNDKEAED